MHGNVTRQGFIRIGIDQNTDACTTTFGNTESSSSEIERSVSISSSVSVGIKVNGGVITQSGFEGKATAYQESSYVRSDSYSLEKTVSFTTGPMEDVVVFQAGTRQTEAGRLVTAGGRVLAVTGTGDTLQQALDRAYTGLDHINFQGMYFRPDIGAKALGQERA